MQLHRLEKLHDQTEGIIYGKLKDIAQHLLEEKPEKIAGGNFLQVEPENPL
jgi:hypothetical protein